MGKKYKKNFAITIFNTITVMCIAAILKLLTAVFPVLEMITNL